MTAGRILTSTCLLATRSKCSTPGPLSLSTKLATMLTKLKDR